MLTASNYDRLAVAFVLLVCAVLPWRLAAADSRKAGWYIKNGTRWETAGAVLATMLDVVLALCFMLASGMMFITWY